MKHVIIKIMPTLLLVFISLSAKAQRNVIYNDNIASLTVMAGNDWQGMPITTLGGNAIRIDFDELSHNYQRYTYRIEHCDADWTPSEGLFSSDYLNGFDEGCLIDSYAESDMTYQLYTHYSLTIPNRNVSITMSGNYKLTVLDDNNGGEPVLTACFMVAEPTVRVQLGVTTNTDIDINNSHQQVSMQVSYGTLNVTNPQEQIRSVILQNQRWEGAVWNPRPQFTMRDGQRWEHNKEMIFPAGNEYHRFETLDPTHTTVGLSYVGWDAENSVWHAYVERDTPVLHYSYSVDANGAFLIRNSDNYEVNTASDYILTHFELQAPKQNGDVYLYGNWTNGAFTPEYQMQWNGDEQIYECTCYLKQGYYSYRYLLMHPDGTTSSISSEGDFYETENSYQSLIYFRGNGDRCDRLVGYADITTREK